MDTLTATEIYSASLVNDIRTIFGVTRPKLVQLAEEHDPQLIVELRQLAERQWSAEEIRRHSLRPFGNWDKGVSALLELNDDARALLADVIIEYYAFCKKEYGECPEVECSRPLILIRGGQHEGYRKCPIHPKMYHLDFDGGGHVPKKTRGTGGFLFE